MKKSIKDFLVRANPFFKKTIKHIIGLLLAPIPFLCISMLLPLIFDPEQIDAAISWAMILGLFIYQAEIFIALPVLLFSKEKLTYLHTIIWGVIIGFLTSLWFVTMTQIYEKDIIVRYFSPNSYAMYILGVFIALIVSSCFWVTNELINKIFKLENTNN